MAQGGLRRPARAGQGVRAPGRRVTAAVWLAVVLFFVVSLSGTRASFGDLVGGVPQIVRLVGKIPTLAALAYHKNSGRKPAPPNQRLSYSENFLYMLDAGSNPYYKPNPRASSSRSSRSYRRSTRSARKRR